MQIKTVCSYCSHEFAVGGNGEVKQRIVKCVSDGKCVNVTYYFCPSCGGEHIVQLDDEYTSDLLQKTQALLRSKVIMSRLGKDVSPKEKKDFKNIRTILTQYRNGLMSQYNGQTFVEEGSDIEFELHCVMGEVKDGGHYE